MIAPWRVVAPKSAWLALAAMLICVALPSVSRAASSSFDHFTTGFELIGQHREAPCEGCHVDAIFKGTPQNCYACHAAGSRIGATAKPTSHMISNDDCAQCHTPFGWKPVAAFNHLNVIGSCSSCHNGVQANGKSVGHMPTTAACSVCHVVTQPWSFARPYPSNHIPTSPVAQCTSCHTSADYSVLPSLVDIHSYAPSTTADCTQCHGASSAAYAIPAANFAIVGVPTNHIPTTGACEACHVGAGSSIAVTPVPNGATFKNSAMSHAGVTTCVGCHGPAVTTFAGITQIVVMPATAPMGTSSHIPSGTACESCHLGSVPAAPVPANATLTAPGTRFQTPVPTTAMIHGGITSGCSSCHEGGNQWMGVSNYAIAPAALSGVMTTQYLGFQTRPGPTAGAYIVADKAHPTTGDCSACHSRTDYFEGQLKPTNHIPYAVSAQCTSCHTGTDFSVMPTLANIHSYAPSTTANCAQCHGSAASTFAIPAANFAIVGEPANHIPTTASCEVCHVGAGSSVAATPVPDGAKFTNSAMGHAGVTSCVECHGPTVTTFAGITKIVVMPATSPMGTSSHIPAGTACEACHQASVPAVLVPANATLTAPGTQFQAPLPTTAMIHGGITSGCSSCHEGGNQWLGVSKYPISPTALTGNPATQYLGFQTRPGKTAGTYSVADGGHPTAGDCAQCHGRTDYFESLPKPSNHIPYAAAAACTNCHTGTDFSVMPSFANIHANAPSTTANCVQCHGSSQAASFANPAANFAIKTLPANHLPTTISCEACHVGAGSSVAATPVADGATFANSAMGHAGVTICVGCHGPTVTGASFYGITKIVVMPPSSPVGLSSHIPSGTACEGCHLGSMPAALVPASATLTAPGTGFASPVPTTAMIHAGITAGCANCHEMNDAWMDMNLYRISPTALTGLTTTQYTGFNTRPFASASTYSVADAGHPTAGDCAQCHGRTDYFEPLPKPANHIPYAPTAACTSCHTGTDFSVLPTVANIHAYAPSKTSNCAQCHGSAAASFAIPAAKFAIVGLPANHIPTTAPCEACHVGAGSSIGVTPVPNGAKFANSAMSHAGLTTCVGCHGPVITGSSFAGITKIVVMPAVSPMGASAHIPSTAACEGCHLGSLPAAFVPANATLSVPGTKFQTPVPTTAMIHAGITSGCSSCHEGANRWLGVSQYPISPTVLTGAATTQYLGFQTRPGPTAGTYVIADKAHPTSGDCSSCHAGTSYFQGQVKPANHIPYAASATCANCHTGTDFSVLPTVANIHAHAPSTTSNCAQCHGSAAASYAIPAANFAIVGLPTNHLPTTASCEACHVGTGSSMTVTPVPNGAKFTNSAMSHAGITTCFECHGPAITGATFVGVTKIVVLPPTSPMGASSHIPYPSAIGCEICHAAAMPGGLMPANAASTVAPGTKFATPVPTTAMIHGGLSSGCSSCHEGGNQWLDMGKYPISPTALTGNPSTQYLGFNTRPGKAASTFSIADSGHPTAGDCSQCHGRTDYFEPLPKPGNHIPYSASAQCTSCHTNVDFSVMPTLANIHAYAPSTTANCAQCHGASQAASFAIPTANFTIKSLPSNHVPTSAACEACHVGAGSSLAATPVPNGATFANSAMRHTGLTTCVGCHGPAVTATTFYGITKIVVMPSTAPMGAGSHLPSGTACEGCHLGSVPAALVPANATRTAPGSLFATPVPTTAMIHASVTSGCSSCHEGGDQWMDMGKYPLSPTALTGVATTQYLGFQTRPGPAAGTFIIADRAHPTTGDCGVCHSRTDYFEGALKPLNHIPYAPAAVCTSCHTGTDFSAMPTLASIHLYAPNTSTNCVQCHGASQAASFAIPAASFTITTTPVNHIPTTAACEACHVGAGSSIAATPVPNGATFAKSAMSHTGITTCVGCHGPTVTSATFYGITKIVVMPPSGAPGINAHIPSGTACEGCHLGSLPAALVPANAPLTAPGTKFQTPAPSTAQIHTGVGSGCTNCHEKGYVWMGANYYPISPTAVTGSASTQYHGFNTRPVATASTYSVADAAHPTSGDCAQCHVGTTYFSAQAAPAGHIPTLSGAACSTCHTTAGNFALYTADMNALHAAVATTCSTCHSDTSPSYTGAPGFAIVHMSTRGMHVPIKYSAGTAECSGCHKLYTTFSGTIMSHAVIGDTGSSAAGMACDACHEWNMRTKWYGLSTWQRDSANHYYCAPGGTTICTGGKGADCTQGCHQHSVSSRYAGVGPKTPRKTIQSAVKPATPGASPAPVTSRPGVPPRRMAFGTSFAVPGRFDHTGVTGTCFSCHNGVSAVGKPTGHLPSGNDCDRCHTTSAWKPAAYDHALVIAGTCASCHNALQAVAKPAGHVATTLSCDSCHYVLGWVPTKPAKPAKPATPAALRKSTPQPPALPRKPGAAAPSRAP